MIRCCLIFLLWGWAHAQQTALLVDGSGSMEGFFQARSIGLIEQAIESAYDEQEVLKQVFINSTTLQGVDYAAMSRYGSTSLIGSALARDLKESDQARILYLVTDNISTDTRVDGDMQTLIRLIQEEPRISSVVLFPMITAFDGMRYNQADEPVGKAACDSPLLMYQIVVDDRDSLLQTRQDLVWQHLSKQLQAPRKVDMLRIRPFFPEAISVHVAPPGNKQFEVVDGAVDTLIYDPQQPFDLGGPIVLNLTFKPYSKLSEFIIDTVLVKSYIPQIKNELFVIRKKHVTVSCTPNMITDVKAERQVENIKMRIQIKELSVKPGFVSYLNCFMSGTTNLLIPVKTEFTFPDRSLRFTTNYSSEFKQQIPRFEDLVKEIYSKENTVTTTFFIYLPGNIPPYIVAAFIIGSILLLAGIAFLILKLIKRAKYSISGTGYHERVVSPLFAATFSLPAMKLTYKSNKWYATSKPDYMLLDETKSVLSAQDECEYTLKFIGGEDSSFYGDASEVPAEEKEVKYFVVPISGGAPKRTEAPNNGGSTPLGDDQDML